MTSRCSPQDATRDDALWLTLVHSGEIARLSDSGELSRYPVGSAECRPSIITAGPDGALWFTLNQGGAIGRIDLDGKVTLHRLPTADAAPVGITYGADDAVWFVEIAAGQVGRLDMDDTIQESRCPIGVPNPTPSPRRPPENAGSPNGAPTVSDASPPPV